MTTTPSTTPGSPVEVFMGLVGQAQGLTAVRAAVELGLFDLIADGHADVATIAAEAKADERGIAILLDTLVALRLVEAHDGATGRYRLSPVAAAVLVSGNPGSVGPMLGVIGELNDLVAPHLADAVRRGGTVLDTGPESPEAAIWERFAAASAGMVQVMAESLAATLGPFAEGREHLDVLDIACGSGLWSLTLAVRQPQARVTLNDWANVLDVTRRSVEGLGLADRTTYLPGDIFAVDLDGPYDLVVASNIFHMWSQQRCRELLSRLAGSLTGDGRIAISGPIATGPPTEDHFAALFSLMVFALTEGGQAHALPAYEAMFADTGLQLLQVAELPGFGRTIIAGRT